MKPKGFANIIIIIAVLVGLSAIASTYLVLETQREAKRPTEPRFCTMAAKRCPDGSYVGRVGPNCEFAACPSAIDTSTSSTSLTAGWQTYRNDKYGFEVKYPCKPGLSCVPPKADSNLGLDFEVTFPTNENSTTVSIGVFDQASLDEWQRVLDSPEGERGDIVSTPDDYDITKLNKALQLPVGTSCDFRTDCTVTLFAGIKALKRDRGNIYGGRDEYLTPHGTYWYSLSIDYPEVATRLESQAAGEEVLQNFKFISPASSTDTSNWQTYRNEQYGFEVKYPSDYKLQLNKTDWFGKSIFGIEFWSDCGDCVDTSPFISGIYVKTSTLEEEEKNLGPDIQKENVIVNGQNVVVLNYTYHGPDGGDQMSSAIIPHASYVYVLNGDRDAVNQLLNSFKFISQ